MKKRLALLLAVAIVFSALSVLIINADNTDTNVKVTGVGIFDQTPNKGIHTFNESAKLMEITFDGTFYDPTQLTNNQKLWVQGEIGDYILINGKTVSAWNGIEFNSVQIHVKYNETMGQYLEINFNGLEGLPTEATDATVELLSTFPIYGDKTLGNDYYFAYKANNNVPFVLTEKPEEETMVEEATTIIEESTTVEEATTVEETTTEETTAAPEKWSKSVSGVGIFDQIPNKGIHTFNESAKLIQVTFGDTFYDPAQLTNNQKLWVQSEFGDYIKINGKSVSEWNGIEFNSVQIHVKYNSTLGQYFEINLNGLTGLPTENSNNTIVFTEDFPIYGNFVLGEELTFNYKAGNNVPFVLGEIEEDTTVEEQTTKAEEQTTAPEETTTKEEETQAPEKWDKKIVGVGIYDQTPKKGIHTFNESAKLIQVVFSGTFYDPAQLDNNQKLWVQSELGSYITINGKTVAEWNEIEFNSVQIHVKNTSQLGQYLEFNLSGLAGLPTEDTDSTFVFHSDFPIYGGYVLGEEITFAYKAGNNVPYARDGIFEEETTAEETTKEEVTTEEETTTRVIVIVEDETTAEVADSTTAIEEVTTAADIETELFDSSTAAEGETTAAQKSEETTATSAKKSSGCNSVIGTGSFMIFMLAVGSIAVFGKKKQ